MSSFPTTSDFSYYQRSSDRMRLPFKQKADGEPLRPSQNFNIAPDGVWPQCFGGRTSP